MHEIQKVLLRRLLTQNGQRYATLTAGYDFEDNVVFHLKQLTTNGYLSKNGSTYSITADGIKTITHFDLGTIEDTGFKTFFVGYLCACDNEYLVKEHLNETETFYNLPSGKPRFGENINNAMIRTFHDLTGITLKDKNFSFLSLHLKTVKTSDGDILFDDAFTIYTVHIDSYQKNSMKPAEHIMWKNVKEISALPNRWPEIDLCILRKDTKPYRTYEVISDYIL